jgi:hypothetical protein
MTGGSCRAVVDPNLLVIVEAIGAAVGAAVGATVGAGGVVVQLGT